MRKSLALASVVVLVCGLVGVSGCSESGGGGEIASVWHLTQEPKATMWDESFAQWNLAHPDQKFKVETYSDDAFKEKVRTAIGAANGPTLIHNWGASGVVAEYVANNKIVDLTGKVDAMLSRTLPSVAAAGQLGSKQYVIPNGDTQPVVMFYNRALFDQAGVNAPLATWDELLASIPKFQAIGVAPIALAGQSQWTNLMWLEYLVDRVGGPSAFNDVAAGKAEAWSNPDILKALAMIQDLVNAGGFQESFASSSADNNADVALVSQGKAAMVLQGAWDYGVFKADAAEFVRGGQLGTFQFPAVRGGKGDTANLVGNPAEFWAVSADASQAAQQAAIDWINTQNMSEAFVDGLIEGGVIPPVPGIEGKLAASEDASFLVPAYQMVLTAPSFQTSWDQALGSVAAEALLSNLDAVFQGSMTPQGFADQMNKTLGK